MTTKYTPMCILSFGYQSFAVPEEDALRVFPLLTSAVPVDAQYCADLPPYKISTTRVEITIKKLTQKEYEQMVLADAAVTALAA